MLSTHLIKICVKMDKMGSSSPNFWGWTWKNHPNSYTSPTHSNSCFPSCPGLGVPFDELIQWHLASTFLGFKRNRFLDDWNFFQSVFWKKRKMTGDLTKSIPTAQFRTVELFIYLICCWLSFVVELVWMCCLSGFVAECEWYCNACQYLQHHFKRSIPSWSHCSKNVLQRLLLVDWKKQCYFCVELCFPHFWYEPRFRHHLCPPVQWPSHNIPAVAKTGHTCGVKLRSWPALGGARIVEGEGKSPSKKNVCLQ